MDLDEERGAGDEMRMSIERSKPYAAYGVEHRSRQRSHSPNTYVLESYSPNGILEGGSDFLACVLRKSGAFT